MYELADGASWEVFCDAIKTRAFVWEIPAVWARQKHLQWTLLTIKNSYCMREKRPMKSSIWGEFDVQKDSIYYYEIAKKWNYQQVSVDFEIVLPITKHYNCKEIQMPTFIERRERYQKEFLINFGTLGNDGTIYGYHCKY